MRVAVQAVVAPLTAAVGAEREEHPQQEDLADRLRGENLLHQLTALEMVRVSVRVSIHYMHISSLKLLLLV